MAPGRLRTCPSSWHEWGYCVPQWWWNYLHLCHVSGKAGDTPRLVPQAGWWVPHVACSAPVRLRTCLSSYHGWGCGFFKLRLVGGGGEDGGGQLSACVCMGKMELHGLCCGVQPVPGDTMVSSPGDQSDHKLALRNIASMVRPGGVLVIDHRNYDHILATGCAPPGKNIYYKVGGRRTLPRPTPLCPSPLAPTGPRGAGSRTVPRLGATTSPQDTDVLLRSPE